MGMSFITSLNMDGEMTGSQSLGSKGSWPLSITFLSSSQRLNDSRGGSIPEPHTHTGRGEIGQSNLIMRKQQAHNQNHHECPHESHETRWCSVFLVPLDSAAVAEGSVRHKKLNLTDLWVQTVASFNKIKMFVSEHVKRFQCVSVPCSQFFRIRILY